MEIDGNLMGHSHSNSTRDQNDNNSNIAWANIWELNSSRLGLDWPHTNTLYGATGSAAVSCRSTTTCLEESGGHTLWIPPHGLGVVMHQDQIQGVQLDHNLYAGGGTHFHPDPHLTCLKLGKRHYFEDATTPVGERHVVGCISSVGIRKRGKALYYGGEGGSGSSSSSPTTVPRCQVEGCHVALINAKDYHRRHKVCEMHSKAPKVLVLGLEQRFCQQCSRFHVVSEFDESKRSCRRRLAGHNERRRKSSHDYVGRNSFQENKLTAGRFPYLSTTTTGCALSLLSTTMTDTRTATSDLSTRSSAALRELIAENRAAVFARQLIFDQDRWHPNNQSVEEFNETEAQDGSNSLLYHQHQSYCEGHGWDININENGEHVTLDLMQAPNAAFGLLSMRGKSKEEDEDSCGPGLWNSFHGGHLT